MVGSRIKAGAVSIAVGGLVVASVAPALAAGSSVTKTTTTHDSTAVNTSSVLRLILNAPSNAALPISSLGSLPSTGSSTPSSADLQVLNVAGTSTSHNSGTASHAATAFAGPVGETSTALDQGVDATGAKASENPGPTSASLPGSSFPSNPVLSGSAVTGSATVSKSDDGSTSTIDVANLNLLTLGQILPASAFTGLQSGVTTLSGTLTTLLSALQALPVNTPITLPTSNPITLPTVPSLPGVPSLPLALARAAKARPRAALPVPLPTALPTNLTSVSGIISGVQGLVTSLSTLPTNLQNAAVIQLQALQGTQSVTHSNGAVTSSATTHLGDLNLLDGLLHITAANTAASSTAAGTPGSASATGSAQVASATLGTSGIVASLASDGTVLGLSIPGVDTSAVTSALQTVATQLNSVLNQTGLGLSVDTTGNSTHTAAADGKSASATAGGLSVTLAPPGEGTVLQLNLGQASSAVTADAVTTATTTSSVPAGGGTTTNTPSGSALPDTGSSAMTPVIGSVLLGLAGLALIERRFRFARTLLARRASH